MSKVITACSIFFRAESYSLESLRSRWYRFILSQNKGVEVDGRAVVLGDHTHVVKDGGRMPGVVSLRETSETQSRPSYFRGQCWGGTGLLVGALSACFCLPLNLQIHLGFKHIGENQATLGLGERIIQMVFDFAVPNNRPCWVVLDAYFSVSPVFNGANSLWSTELKQPFIHVITRAKSNYVAYYPAPPRNPRQVGRPAIYGEKVTLWEVFDHEPLFQEVTMEIYGKQESVQILSADLLWKPIGRSLLFVWAITSRGPIVLMSSNLNAAPETILGLYCRRVRIEVLFDTLKNVIGAFKFHFWTTKLPRHSRRPVTNTKMKSPEPDGVETVKKCWRAMEVFVFCAVMATGFLQIFSLKYTDGIWKQHILYLRTRSRELPSEKTTRQIVTSLLARQLSLSRPGSILWKINNAVNGDIGKNTC